MATGGGGGEQPADSTTLALIERSLKRFVSEQRCHSNCEDDDDASNEAMEADPSLYPYLEAVLTDDDDDESDIDSVLELMRAHLPLLAATPDAALRDWLVDCRRRLTAASAVEAAVAQSVDAASGPTAGQSESFAASESTSASAVDAAAAEAQVAEAEAAAEALERMRALFPEACAVGLRRRLAVSGGDLQAAVELCLEVGGDGSGGPPVCPRPPCACLEAEAASVAPAVDSRSERQEVKSYIMRRFENYELPDERKIHRPEARFDERPRLTRYLEGRVVAQNGARYVEIKDERAEEIRKATTVCIKPARKYRFH